MVFRARSTRKVLRAEMLPKSTNSVRYLGQGVGVKTVSESGADNEGRNHSSSRPRMRIPEEFLWLGLPQGVEGRRCQTPQGSSWALRAGKTVQEL